MIDTLTIIRARRGRRLAKLIRADGTVEDYNSAYRIDLLPQPVADLDTLHGLLVRLLPRPDCAVVRGVPIDAENCRAVRRLAYADKKTGDLPTLRPEPHTWVALDLDGVERPDTVPAVDLAGCAAVAIQRLPAAFHGARCIVQASASHGVKPGCRLRLWYWLDRFATDAELTRWLRGTPCDPSVFRTVQPIYSAAPVFAAGVRDHLPTRIMSLPGASVVAVPPPDALKPPARVHPAAPLPDPGDTRAARYAFAALVNAAMRVRQASIGQRHPTILGAARGLARFIDAGLLDKGNVVRVLRDAGQDIDKPADEIDSIIEWAMAHPSVAALPQGVAA